MPPFVGVAVKDTEVPEQIVIPGFATMLTDGITAGLTVIVTELLVAGFPVAQGVAFDVKITLTISPFARVVEVKVALLLPTFEPFTCH